MYTRLITIEVEASFFLSIKKNKKIYIIFLTYKDLSQFDKAVSVDQKT